MRKSRFFPLNIGRHNMSPVYNCLQRPNQKIKHKYTSESIFNKSFDLETCMLKLYERV